MKQLLFIFILACSTITPNLPPPGDFTQDQLSEIALPNYIINRSINLLILYDHSLAVDFPSSMWERNLGYFLWKLQKNYNVNIALSGLDNRDDFVYHNNKQAILNGFEGTTTPYENINFPSLRVNLETDPPGLRYTYDKLVILRNNGFFHPKLNTYVIILSPVDDWDIYRSMDGKIIKDQVIDRINKLLSLNETVHTNELEKVKYYDYRELRIFSIVPLTPNCKDKVTLNYKYKLASKQIYEHFNGSHRRYPDYYDYCSKKITDIFLDIYSQMPKH